MTPRTAQSFGNETSSRRFSLNGPLAVSLIALLVAGGVVLTAMATVITTALGMNADDAQVAKQLDKSIESNRTKMEKYVQQFEDRSIFFKPQAWPARPAPPPPPPTGPTVPTPPPTKVKSTVYTGPGILYAIGDVIRFKPKTASDKPLDIRVGEEKNGVRVISTNLPWTVKVFYEDQEWDVEIWPRGEDKFLLAQAKPIEIVPYLLEVPAAKPEIAVPKATGSPDEAVSAQPEGAAGENPREAARDAVRDRGARRGARQDGSRQPPPARPAPTPEEDGEDEEAADEEEAAADQEVAEEEEVDEDEEEEPEAVQAPPGRRGAPPVPADEEEEESEDDGDQGQGQTPQRSRDRAPGRPQPTPQR